MHRRDLSSTKGRGLQGADFSDAHSPSPREWVGSRGKSQEASMVIDDLEKLPSHHQIGYDYVLHSDEKRCRGQPDFWWPQTHTHSQKECHK